MREKVGHFLFRYRNAMFPLVAAPLLLPGSEPFDDTLWAAGGGFVVAAFGQWIRMMTIGLRYIVRGGRGGRVYAEELVTDGVYAHIRNPMYVGNLSIALGVAIASNSWTTLIVGMSLAVFMYTCIVAAEEQYLTSRFGEAYRAYCRDVPRWIPRFKGLRQTLVSMRFHWQRVVVKEYGTPFGWISILAAITLYGVWDDGDWDARPIAIHSVMALVAATTVFWFIAWRLKRSRTLRAD